MGNHQSSLIRIPYDNYKMIHPDGTLMCYCSKKKALWYSTRDLATLDGYDLKLKFTPNGYGDPNTILEGRDNKCVISGKTESLTKHHVIPSQYRIHFKSQFKDKNSSDLVVLTRETHDEYELEANNFKELLYRDFSSPEIILRYEDINEAKGLHRTLSKHLSKIPPAKQIYMQMKLEGLLDRLKIKVHELDDDAIDPFKTINKLIVENLGEINLIVLWKLHFLKYGKPKYMPFWWKPNMIKVIKNGKQINVKSELMEVDMTEENLLTLIKKYDLYETACLYL